MPKVKDHKKVDRLYDAAFRLILKTGFAGFKMSTLAEEAGVATGTAYTYFENKSDLINQLFRRIKKDKNEILYGGLDIQAPAFDQFRELWKRYFTYALQHPERNHFIHQYELSDHLDQESKALRDSAYVHITHIMETLRKEGKLKDIPIPILLAYATGGSNRVARLYFGREVDIDDAFLDDCFSLVWSAIAK